MADKKEYKRLTIAELRNFKGFEGYTDEQAEETISTLEKLSVLFYKLHMKNQQVGKTFKISQQEDLRNIRGLNKHKRKHENGSHSDQSNVA
jgi:hypothetical protein